MKQKRKVTKKIAAWFLCLAMVLTIVNLLGFTKTVYAATKGSGSQVDPYVVTTYDELRDVMMGSTGEFYVKLGADIKSEDDKNIYNLWLSKSNRTSCVLDLAGHSIYRSATTTDSYLIGVGSNYTLSIYDSVSGGKVSAKINNGNATKCLLCVFDGGNLIIHDGEYVLEEDGSTYAQDCIVTAGGKTIIYGGSFESLHNAIDHSSGEIIINDGYFESTGNASYGLYMSSNHGSFVVNNCTTKSAYGIFISGAEIASSRKWIDHIPATSSITVDGVKQSLDCANSIDIEGSIINISSIGPTPIDRVDLSGLVAPVEGAMPTTCTYDSSDYYIIQTWFEVNSEGDWDSRHTFEGPFQTGKVYAYAVDVSVTNDDYCVNEDSIVYVNKQALATICKARYHLQAYRVFKNVIPQEATQVSGNIDDITWELNRSTGKLVITGKGEIANMVESGYPWKKYGNDIISVEIGNGITNVPKYAFGEYGSYPYLSYVELPNTIVTIDDAAFFGAHFTEIKLPTSLKTIGEMAFDYSALESIEIPEGVTEVGNSAFMMCKELNSVFLPNSMKKIGDGAFYSCSKIKKVCYHGTSEEYKKINMGSDNDITKITTTFTAHEYGKEWKTDDTKHWHECKVCGKKEEATHTNTTITTKATLSKDGSKVTKCSVCGKVASTTTIAMPKTFTLSKTSVEYTGSQIKPTITVKDKNGTTIAATNYTLTYGTNKAVGKGTVKVTFKSTSNYSGNKELSFNIIPKKTTIGTPAIASDGITVKWTKNTSCAGYYIYRSVNGASYTKVKTITSNATVSWKDTTAKTNGNKYQYKIVAYKIVSGTTYTSAASAIKTTYFLTRPTVTLTNTSTGVKVAWGKNAKATGYYVYKSTDGGKTYKKVKTVTSNATVSYTDTVAKTNGTKYMYKVEAYKTVSSTTYKSAVSAIKTYYFVSKPAISSLTNSAAGKILIKWARNAKATGYQIQYSTSADFSGAKTVTATGTTSTLSKTIASLTKGKTYYVRIRSYKTVGTTKFYSAWSDKKSVKITK